MEKIQHSLSYVRCMTHTHIKKVKINEKCYEYTIIALTDVPIRQMYLLSELIWSTNTYKGQEESVFAQACGLIVLCTCVGVCSSDHYHRCPDPSGLSEPQTIVLRLSEDWRLIIHVLHIHNHLQTQTHSHILLHTHYI